jgi:hypothetical protein
VLAFNAGEDRARHQDVPTTPSLGARPTVAAKTAAQRVVERSKFNTWRFDDEVARVGAVLEFRLAVGPIADRDITGDQNVRERHEFDRAAVGTWRRRRRLFDEQRSLDDDGAGALQFQGSANIHDLVLGDVQGRKRDFARHHRIGNGLLGFSRNRPGRKDLNRGRMTDSDRQQNARENYEVGCHDSSPITALARPLGRSANPELGSDYQNQKPMSTLFGSANI